MNRIFAFHLLTLLIQVPTAFSQDAPPFELLDGDRVALIGDTFIEREQAYGYLEHILTTHYPDRHVIFRNLGWSADTPAGVSRAGFDLPDKGFDRLKEQVAAYKPTVVFLGYGMACSFDAEPGLSRFTEEMNRLMDTIQELSGSTNQVRFVLLNPIKHEKLAPPLPDPAKHNELLALYTKAIKELAEKRKARFVNLFELLDNNQLPPPYAPLTDNGIHLTAYGYRRAAEALAMGLNWYPHAWRAGITREGTAREGSYGAGVLELEKRTNYVRVVIAEEQIGNPPWLEHEQPQPLATPAVRMQVIGLTNGIYELRIGGQLVRTLTERECGGSGFTIEHGPLFEQAEQLRQAILKKNELFFHRWRPQNNTYLFLFRKHEQGQNAKEIPQFDPLVQAEEQKIAKLRRPVRHTIELIYSTNYTTSISNFVARKTSQAPPPVTAHPATPFKPQAPVHFQLADTNLEVTLWAENPLLAKPIQINWDAAGRLWVASSSVYPQIEPGQTADDKILILEDTNGDSKADKTTVFAENLLIPSAVEPGDGGAYVGQSTELLHFKDTDGDGMADQKRVVLSGFGTEDTHHTLHTLRWGHDGQLYMNQSIYIHSHIETPHGVVRLNSGGTLALRPDTMELGVHMKGLINGWGHDFDDFGQSFQTDGAGGQGINWIIPQAMYVTYERARRILGSVSPGSYPKLCGLEILKSEHFPKDWQGNAITCDFRANRLVRFEILDQDAAYTTKQHEFLRSTNVTFRPIDVKVGPDGALYIADWSNPIIQHGEVDFRDPRRDRVHGRIWRVSYEGGKDVKKPELVKASNAELLNQLVSPNGFNQDKARRLLMERSAGKTGAAAAVKSDLAEWTKKQTDESALLYALWMHQALDVVEIRSVALLQKLLEASDARIRAAATRVLGLCVGNTPGVPSLAKRKLADRGVGVSPAGSNHADETSALQSLDLLAKLVQDDHPRVRIEALRALARIPTARSAELALSVLDKGEVKGFLEYALWLTINDLAEPWAAAVESGAWKVEGREKQLQFALKAIEPKLATRLMTKVIGDKPLPRDGAGGMIELIGQAGGPDQLRKLFDQVLNGGFTTEATTRALNWLADAARLRNVKPTGDLEAISKLIERTDEDVRAPAARLAGSWKLGALAPALAVLASRADSSEVVRRAAIEGLRELGGKDAVPALRALTKDNNERIRQAAAAALAATDLSGSMTQILDVVSTISKEDDALALWRSLLAVKGASDAFTKALRTATLPEAAARAGLRVAREGGRNEPNLVLALNKAGGLSDPTSTLTENEIHAIAYEVTKGNLANGEKIYRRKELSCVVCHSIGGAGGKVGPDMTSLGAATPLADYIVEAVLLPNKRIKEGYNSVQVTTKDGEELSGNMVRESSEELILRDPTNKEFSIPKRKIQSRAMGGSLMPAGLLDILSPTERLDLYAFLWQLGKPGPYDATKQNVARVWRVNPALGTANAEDILKADVRGQGWFPVYSTVAGDVPKPDLEAEVEGSKDAFWAATRFQTAKAGAVKLKLSGTASPKAWIDGKAVGGNSDIVLDLPTGAHSFLLKVNARDIDQALRLESDDATFLVD